MTALVPIQSEDNTGNVRANFALQNTSDQVNVLGFDGTSRWSQTYKNYESYAVKGMKIKYIPTNARGGISQNVDGNLVNGTGTISSSIHQ